MTVPVLYVGGTGRSGSTVLAEVLAQRPGAVAVGELRYLWDRGLRENHLCGCLTPFSECEFWTAVLKEAFGSAVATAAATIANLAPAVDRIRHIPSLRQRHRLPGAYADVLASLYRAILDVSGGELIVDSSKDPSYAFVLNRVPDLTVSLLHLVRDSRAVAYSWTRKKLRPEIHWRREYMRIVPPRQSAAIWLLYNQVLEVFPRGPGRYARVRYEDFVAEGGRVPPSVWPEVTPAVAEPRPFPHSISGNPVRFDQTNRVLRLDNEWRAKLPARDRRVVTAISSPLLLRYGYLGRRDPRVLPTLGGPGS